MAGTIEKIKWYKKMYGMGKTCRYLKNKVLYGYMDDYPRWQKKHAISEAELEEQRAARFEKEPLISIVVPLYKTPIQYLATLVESVKAQTYANWELCLSDGSGKSESDNDAGGAVQTPLRAMLGHLQGADSRIHAVTSDIPLGISDNTNRALDIAKGEYIAFADHDDLLAPNALYENVKVINEHPDVQLIYSDEDKIDGVGKRYFMPHFKSDYNQAMLESTNYFCHLCLVCRSLCKQVGGLISEYDGAQDYDFMLRCVEQIQDKEQIRHIPKILYHWRAYEKSTAESADNKEYANDAGIKALKAHYDRIGVKADIELVEKGGVVYPGMYRTRYQYKEQPLVSVLLIGKIIDDFNLDVILDKISYQNTEIIVPEKEQYPSGEYVLFLEIETVLLADNIIQELLGYCMQPGVGVVGAKIYGFDGNILHAGSLLKLDGTKTDSHKGYKTNDPGFFVRAIIAQDTSAVSKTCMMVKQSIIKDVFGNRLIGEISFDDLCDMIRTKGYRIVFDPFAEVMIPEATYLAINGSETDAPIQDGYYNINLTPDRADFDLDTTEQKE